MRFRGGGVPPLLSSEGESKHDYSGGGPSLESEGHALAQRQQPGRKRPFESYEAARFAIEERLRCTRYAL